MIDPRPRIGQPHKFDAPQIADRPLQARCGRVKDRKRRGLARAHLDGCAHDATRRGLIQGAMHGSDIAPQSEEIQFSLAQRLTDAAPPLRIHCDAPPRAVGWDAREISEKGFEHRGAYPS